jgi:RiboL-PSP-HEPN
LWTDDLSRLVLSSGGVGIERERLSRAAITILIAGSFEYHLRQFVLRFITAVNRLKIPFAKLPDSVRRCHIERGAEFLQATAKKERKESKKKQVSPPYVEAQRLSAQLASVGSGVPYELIWEAFAETHSNPGPEVVKGILSGLNTKKPWPTIAQNAPNPYVTPGAKPAAKQNNGVLEGLLISDLRNLVIARNRCAHGAIDSAVPALSTLYEYLNAVDAISAGIHDTLEGELLQLKASITPAPSATTMPPSPTTTP